MPFDDTNNSDPYAGVRRLAETVQRKRDWYDHLVRQAKGGNPNKLISERDLHAINFANIDAAYRRAVKS